jgi:hypothetical protein
MLKIVKANNNYYLYNDYDFFGPYHSIADATFARHTLDKQHKISIEESAQLLGYKFITIV